jgi:hypothetical protein
MARLVFATSLMIVSFAVPSFAADAAAGATSEQTATATTVSMTMASVATALPMTPVAAETTSAPSIARINWSGIRRPAVLPALYAGSAILQGFDAYSTMSALKAGATEANPLMKGAVKNPLVLIGLKAVVTTTSIIAAERMWRGHNRIGAIALMAVSNGVMAAVAAHNSSVLKGLR